MTTVRNPGNPDHFMHVLPVRGRVRVTRAGRVLADSRDALRIIETGRHPYDPVIYFPRTDVSDDLTFINDKSTHCPLKGDASYLAVDGDEIAWTYDLPLADAELIRDYVAFHANKVTIEEIGAQA